MKYQFTDVDWNRKKVRIIRIENGKWQAGTSGAFHNEGEGSSDSRFLTMEDNYNLERLRQQNEAEGRLVYFDIDMVHPDNSSGLEAFESQYEDWVADDLEWQQAHITS